MNHPDQDAPFQCYRCRNPICVECESKVDGRSICPACLAQIRDRIASQYQAETRNINYSGAVIAGSIAALAAGYAWSQIAVLARGYRFEAGAAVVGGIVGWAVTTAAGRKRHLRLQRIASVLALFGIIAAHFLILLRTGQAPRLGGSGFDSALTAALYAFPTYLSGLNFLDWIFLVVGVGWAFYIPHVRTIGGPAR